MTDINEPLTGLGKCPNPLHTFKFAKLLFSWQIASDYWANRDASGNRVRHWFGISTIKALDGDETALLVTIHKLQIGIAPI